MRLFLFYFVPTSIFQIYISSYISLENTIKVCVKNYRFSKISVRISKYTRVAALNTASKQIHINTVLYVKNYKPK